MPTRRILALAAACAIAAACDQPTAPQAREEIEKTELAVLSGGPQLDFRLGQMFADAGGPGVLATGKFNDLVTVQRDGSPVRYVGTVIERVYLPPPSVGGKPIVKRLLLAWDRESRRGLAIAADEAATVVALPTKTLLDDNSADRLWSPRAFVIQNEQNGRQAWFGTEGQVAIIPGPTVGECPFKNTDPLAYFPSLGTSSKVGSICQQLQYTVSVAATLEKRRAVDDAGLFDRFRRSHMDVRLIGQSVSGSRIVTQCPDSLDMQMFPPMECMGYVGFWRDQSLFAPSIGLDVSRLRSPPHGMGEPYYDIINDGTGKAFACCSQSNAAVRYAVYAPNGTLIHSAIAPRAMRDSILQKLPWLDLQIFRDGTRVLALVPGRRFDRTAGHQPAIIDLTIIRCPDGLVRNDTSFPGNAYPDGGCYPASNLRAPRRPTRTATGPLYQIWNEARALDPPRAPPASA
jgi:hypothetical protein